jgi:predicted nuclease of predicted toxin-antitoxin system
MRFIIDESTGSGVVNYLQSQGYDAVSVVDIMPQADDIEILRYAYAENRLVITNDKDFGDLIFRSQEPHQGIVLLRLQDESGINRVSVISRVIAQYAEHLPGRFTVATEKNIRFRPKLK